MDYGKLFQRFFILLMTIIFITIPLAVWKIIDLIIWMARQHG